jgi:coenzyme F420-reducing hydrogenase delta subunit
VGDCHFLEGNLRAKERVEYAKDLLDELGLGSERLEMYHIGASDAPLWVKRVKEMTARVEQLGPNPLRTVAGEEGNSGSEMNADD